MSQSDFMATFNGEYQRQLGILARYDAAETNGSNWKHWCRADSMSANAAASPDIRKILRERSRYEIKNNSYGTDIPFQTVRSPIPQSGPRQTATMMDLGQAADIVTDVGTAFGITGGKVVRVADVMAQAAANSNTTIEMMGQSFKYLAPFANAAAQSIEEMGAVVGLLAGSGIKATTAGTATREALINLTNGVKSRKLLQMTGVTGIDAAGEVKPFLDVVKELKVALANMPTGQRLDIITQVFGKRGGNAVLALMSRTNEELDSMRQKMLDSGGAAAQMAATIRDSLMGSWKGLVSAIESVQIAIGEALTPMLRAAMDSITLMVRDISTWITENKEVAITYGLITVGILGTGAALVALGAALSGIATIMTPITVALTGMVIGVGAASSMAIGMAGAALTATVTLVAALPGIVLGAMTLILGLVQAVAAAFAGVISAIMGIPALITGIVTTAIGLWSTLVAITGTIATGITAVTPVVFEGRTGSEGLRLVIVGESCDYPL